MELLSFKKTKEILDKYKVPFCKTFFIASKEEAIVKANEIGYPVVLKNFSKNAIHKTEAGGVKTNIESDRELSLAWEMLYLKEGDEVIVQEMAKGKEVILGMKRDEQFGTVLMFGLGGIFVEVLKDVSLRVAPIDLKEAISMIKEVKGYDILRGARGQAPVNIDKIAEIIVLLSDLSLREQDIKEIDLNPVMVAQDKAAAVDARFLV